MDSIPAIDVHGHCGLINGFPQTDSEKQIMTLSLEEIEQENKKANIYMSCFSPAEGIFPFEKVNIIDANEKLYRLSEEKFWLFQWVVIHPEISDTFSQAERMLRSRKCVGIKIHPDAHGYKISDYGDKIFKFASKYDTVIESHAGDVYSLPEEFVVYANRYPNVKIIISHLGNSFDGDVTHHIQAIQKSRYGNVYTDCSSAKSVFPKLIEWAVSEIGSEQILFGTDVPIHHIGMMRGRIDFSNITDDDKKNIFYKNAKKLWKY